MVLQNSETPVDPPLKSESDHSGNGQLEFGACPKQLPTEGATSNEPRPVETSGLEQLPQRFRQATFLSKV